MDDANNSFLFSQRLFDRYVPKSMLACFSAFLLIILLFDLFLFQVIVLLSFKAFVPIVVFFSHTT